MFRIYRLKKSIKKAKKQHRIITKLANECISENKLVGDGIKEIAETNNTLDSIQKFLLKEKGVK